MYEYYGLASAALVLALGVYTRLLIVPCLNSFA
jgi:hypothetical protein